LLESLKKKEKGRHRPVLKKKKKNRESKPRGGERRRKKKSSCRVRSAGKRKKKKAIASGFNSEEKMGTKKSRWRKLDRERKKRGRPSSIFNGENALQKREGFYDDVVEECAKKVAACACQGKKCLFAEGKEEGKEKKEKRWSRSATGKRKDEACPFGRRKRGRGYACLEREKRGTDHAEDEKG